MHSEISYRGDGNLEKSTFVILAIFDLSGRIHIVLYIYTMITTGKIFTINFSIYALQFLY